LSVFEYTGTAHPVLESLGGKRVASECIGSKRNTRTRRCHTLVTCGSNCVQDLVSLLSKIKCPITFTSPQKLVLVQDRWLLSVNYPCRVCTKTYPRTCIGGFTRLMWLNWDALGTKEQLDLRGSFNTTPLFFHYTPLSFRSWKYQSTELNNSPYTTEQAQACEKCRNIPLVIIITASIPRSLILCQTIQSPMIDPNSYPGYHPWIPVYDIATFKSAGSTMSGNGSWGLRNSGNGAD